MTPGPYVLPFEAIRAGDLARVGGKGANLGELSAAGFAVPPGFCLTVAAYERFLAGLADAETMIAELEALRPGDHAAAQALSGRWQSRLRAVPVPPEVAQAAEQAWRTLGPGHAYAVRSSATAEDLPGASFAGQQDTFLNVRGLEGLLGAIRDCWASLFNERALLYRAQVGVAPRGLGLAVVVQRLIDPEVSGILFTADPTTGQRGLARIDAAFGLGEALVSGVVSADAYTVDRQNGRVTGRIISGKTFALRSAPQGGIRRVPLGGDQAQTPALTDAQALALAELGGRIEAHYGVPQDIEWAGVGGQWYVLQSRPITTLFPLPAPAPGDGQLHAYLSFSHLQVMTDALPPLAASLWRVLFPIGRPPHALENPLLTVAGGRLYLDISYALRYPLLRRVLPRAAGANIDARMGDPLAQLAARPEFQRGPRVSGRRALRGLAPVVGPALGHLLRPERGDVAAAELESTNRLLGAFRAALDAAPTLDARLEVVMGQLRTLIGPPLYPLVSRLMAGVLSDTLLRQFGARFAARADLIAVGSGQRGNVTTEMGLALGDLADAAHGHADLIARLRRTELSAQERLDVGRLPGGEPFLTLWQTFLARYGARASSEIDLSRPRWHDDPAPLLNMLTGQLGAGAGTHRQQAQALQAGAQQAAGRVLRAAGPFRGLLVRHLVRAVRTYLPLREHPKFLLVRVLGLVRPVLQEAGVVLAARGQLGSPGQVWCLTLPELQEAVAHPDRVLDGVASARQTTFAHDSRLRPPRVMTSDGEIITGRPVAQPMPDGALGGQPVSAGVVEGRARVMLSLADPPVQPGEILIAPFTDPGWTPLFVAAAGLVTEVGGLMTHGSLVAREYGLPAVVGVEDATRRIRSGQRVRVNGDLGYVEVLN
ncbi:phosphoenolpyruvate synthase [Deinococcus koreensis]|uniref:Phosphoenolpyruvate synthase n=1 Tax=Deinococcus koreensis TaxID=2054903 RepID=A0A2K3UUC1_9DEIO|nr:phosphoenolpyruvate synthase [Deinococcus koreensis]PNY80135.1 phosphoenolpyruvate synthase [Deinococcus koreensis]